MEEIIIYEKKLSKKDRKKAEKYLFKKYSIKNNYFLRFIDFLKKQLKIKNYDRKHITNRKATA